MLRMSMLTLTLTLTLAPTATGEWVLLNSVSDGQAHRPIPPPKPYCSRC